MQSERYYNSHKKKHPLRTEALATTNRDYKSSWYLKSSHIIVDIHNMRTLSDKTMSDKIITLTNFVTFVQ